jgi:hypothetical protein
VQLNRIWYIPLILILALVFAACAKVGKIYGGPKDETPPTVIKTKPAERATYFVPQKKVIISFDEYIQLKDIFQEMMISPPINGNISALINGKSLFIEFPEEAVFDSTTYTLSFGNSIADNNEGNILKNYEYVFSFKGFIDSMNVAGKIVNSYNHKPDAERMLIMLYKNLADSAPLLEKPMYVSKSDAQGNFAIHNLEEGIYSLFALKDKNSNMIFDLPDEQIAFNDSLVILTPERFKDDVIIEDSILFETLTKTDTTVVDTSVVDSIMKEGKAYTFQTEMLFFIQDVKNQYLTNHYRLTPEQLTISFKQTLRDDILIEPMNFIPKSDNWYILDKNLSNDSLTYWLTDTSLISMDTLTMKVSYPAYDTTGNTYYAADTLSFLVQKEKPSSQKGSRNKNRTSEKTNSEEVKEVKRISLKNNIDNPGAFDLDKQIILTSATPAFDFRADRIKMVRMKDTIEIPVVFQMRHDSASFYRFIIDYKPEEQTSYSLLIPDSTITDIYGLTNDTLQFGFKTQAEDYYGSLNIRMTGIKSSVIIQLLDDKELILIEQIITSDDIIRFEFMQPKSYRLKAIIDTNGNGKWDTGNYLLKIQPEQTKYYSQPVDIRSNWEMDIAWELEY